MKKNLIFEIFSVLIVFFLFTNCKKDFSDNPDKNANEAFHRNTGKALMELSYEITTSRKFEADPTTLSDLDLASTNPKNEKQNVTMKLFEDGHIFMTIEEVDFDKKINIPHQTLPDTSPKITKTVISGNFAEFYSEDGTLINTVNVPIPNQIELVQKIKEIGNNVSQRDIEQVITSMQGYNFIDNLESFLSDAPNNNIQITDRGNGLVTARMPMSELQPQMDGDIVLLIDRNINRLVGMRMYSPDNTLLKTILFAYNNGDVQSLKAIKTIELFTLPSGNETKMITLSKIDNLKFNLNF